MGILVKASIFGEIKGKVGREVICGHRSQTVIKSAPGKRLNSDEKTKRVKDKALFKLVNVIVGKLTKRLPKGLLKQTYQLPANAKYTAHNAMTKQVWSDALTGEYPDHYIDLSLVKFSKPLRPTEKARNVKLAIADDELQVSWELNPLPDKTTRLDDLVYVVCFDIDQKMVELLSYATVRRSDLLCSEKLIYHVSGHQYCFWLFLLSADGKRVSETQCLGTVIIP